MRRWWALVPILLALGAAWVLWPERQEQLSRGEQTPDAAAEPQATPQPAGPSSAPSSAEAPSEREEVAAAPPPAAPGTRLYGQIRREGAPVAEAMVWFTNPGQRLSTFTDAEGHYSFRFTEAAAGQLLVGELSEAKVQFGDGLLREHVEPVALAQGEELRRDVDLHPGALEIKVVDQQGRPRSHAVWVNLMPTGPDPVANRLAERVDVVDGAGVARFGGLPPGDYWVNLGPFLTRQAEPTRLLLHHPGGVHRETVRSPAPARLRVIAKVQADEESTAVEVPVWVLDRDGMPAHRWEERFQSARPGYEDSPASWRELSPGFVRVRAGHPQHGYAEAEIALAEGARETLELDLQPRGPEVRFLLPVVGFGPGGAPTRDVQAPSLNQRLLFDGSDVLQVVDTAGRLVVELQLPLRHRESDEPSFTMRLPQEGNLRVYRRGGPNYVLLGEYTVTTHGAQIPLPPPAF